MSEVSAAIDFSSDARRSPPTRAWRRAAVHGKAWQPQGPARTLQGEAQRLPAGDPGAGAGWQRLCPPLPDLRRKSHGVGQHYVVKLGLAANERKSRFPNPTGSHRPAQGNALGSRGEFGLALKGRDISSAVVMSRPFRASLLNTSYPGRRRGLVCCAPAGLYGESPAGTRRERLYRVSPRGPCGSGLRPRWASQMPQASQVTVIPRAAGGRSHGGLFIVRGG